MDETEGETSTEAEVKTEAGADSSPANDDSGQEEAPKPATAKKVELNVEEKDDKVPDKPEMRAPQNSFVSIHNMYQQTSARYDRRKASNFLRMSTVTISTKRHKQEANKTKSEFTDEPKQRRKKSLPAPNVYSPRLVLVRQTAPTHVIAERDRLKEGGGRTSWETNMFVSAHDVWSRKTRYDDVNWPSPCQYAPDENLQLGKSSYITKTAPAYTMPGVGRENSIFVSKYSASIPASIKYDRGTSDRQTKKKAPAFKMGIREGTMLWPEPEKTPAPGTYLPKIKSVKTHFPAFSIPTARSEKRMDSVVGPVF